MTPIPRIPSPLALLGSDRYASFSLQFRDLQGVRDVESANSESVEELLEEGNPFEAGIVAGIEIETHVSLVKDVPHPEEYSLQQRSCDGDS